MRHKTEARVMDLRRESVTENLPGRQNFYIRLTDLEHECSTP